jgi:hypothetical protein
LEKCGGRRKKERPALEGMEWTKISERQSRRRLRELDGNKLVRQCLGSAGRGARVGA